MADILMCVEAMSLPFSICFISSPKAAFRYLSATFSFPVRL